MQGAQIPSDEAGIPYAAKTPVRGRSQTGGAHRRTGRRAASRIALFDGLPAGCGPDIKKALQPPCGKRTSPGMFPDMSCKLPVHRFSSGRQVFWLPGHRRLTPSRPEGQWPSARRLSGHSGRSAPDSHGIPFYGPTPAHVIFIRGLRKCQASRAPANIRAKPAAEPVWIPCGARFDCGLWNGRGQPVPVSGR